MLGGSSVVTEI